MQRTIKIKSELGITLVAVAYGNERDGIVRISVDEPTPTDIDDNYCPSADLGYIWFRVVDGQSMATGYFDVAIASRANSAERILSCSVVELFEESEEQVDRRIALVDIKNTLIQGEMDIFCDGRG